MISYWNNLNIRERWAAIIGGGAALLYIFYAFVYSPLADAVTDKSIQLTEKQSTLAWMKQVKKTSSTVDKPKPINNSRLLTMIATNLRADNYQKFTHELQQTGQGDIQLSFERVPYNLFLTWLWQLYSGYTISLKQVSIEKTDTAGVVKVLVIIAADSA